MVKIFLDTADISEIRTAVKWGVIDGVTTNPTLYAKAGGGTYDAVLKDHVELVTDAIDRVTEKGVRLKDGREIELDLLVVATGSESGLPPIPGAEGAKVVRAADVLEAKVNPLPARWRDRRADVAKGSQRTPRRMPMPSPSVPSG